MHWIMNINPKEPQNFVRKYSLTVELLSFMYRRPFQVFNHMIIDEAARQCRLRLRVSIRASGEHFEHRL